MAGDTLDSILHKIPGVNGKAKPEQRVMTIRMPADLHAALQAEARERNTSVNRIALAKLALKAEVLDYVVESMAEMDNEKVCTNGRAD